MAFPFPSSFLAPPPTQSSRSTWRPPTPAFRPSSLIQSNLEPSGPSILHLEATTTPLDLDVAPLGSAPLVVLVAAVLAFSAQSWINSLLGGDQGLGAFLSDGGGFNRSGFKPRRRPIGDDRTVPGDATRPLGGPDPLPWLKLPELDFVDVAGQPKKPKQMRRSMKDVTPSSIGKDDPEVVAKLEFLQEQMKFEVDKGNLGVAKGLENELKRVMKEEGYDYSA